MSNEFVRSTATVPLLLSAAAVGVSLIPEVLRVYCRWQQTRMQNQKTTTHPDGDLS